MVRLPQQVKKAYPIPMYVNAWIKQPSLGHRENIQAEGQSRIRWTFGDRHAPAIDFISPDIYVAIPDARYTIEQYHRPGNPVFIPEFKPGAASASLAFWAFASA